MEIWAIAAISKERAIGVNGELPWHLPVDMKHFRELTGGATVLMGRKTYQSLSDKFRPLPNRKNVVVTRDHNFNPGNSEVEVVTDIENWLMQAKKDSSKQRVWVIGGAEIYSATLKSWDGVALTRVNRQVQGDAFFPPFEDQFVLTESRAEGSELIFETYLKRSR